MMNKTEIKQKADQPFSSGSQWIWSQEGCGKRRARAYESSYEVRRFRKIVETDAGEGEVVVHISADSRYVLFWDGVLVGRGPAHGDIRHHFYDTYTLPNREGRHLLAVLVIDYSPVQCDPPRIGAPAAVMTRTGGLAAEVLLRNLDGEDLQLAQTDASWRVAVDEARRFQPGKLEWFGGFMGLFEEFVAEADTSAGWEGPDFDDSAWEQATAMYPAERHEAMTDAASPYGLMERIVPNEIMQSALRPSAVFAPGGGSVSPEWTAFVHGGKPIKLPADCSITVLIEYDKEWTAFPSLEFSGGAGAEVRVGYAEALRLPYSVADAVIFGRGCSTADVAIGFEDATTGWTFDHRGTFEGFEDILRPDGRAWCWQPHHWRTAKFIRLDMRTGQQPLELRAFRFDPTHAPLDVAEPFTCSDERLEGIYETSLHTLRIGMHETFMDCPYFEQLQYIGDSALNAQLAMLAGGAWDHARQLVLHFDWSRVPEGWTPSRYPSRNESIIPSQSLDWMSIIHSYALFTGDFGTIREVWPGALCVIDAYRRHTLRTGLPENLPFWNWIDWCPGWKRGVPPGADSGPVLSHAAKYGVALKKAAEVAFWLGEEEAALGLGREHEQLTETARKKFWNGEFFSETPGKPDYGSRIGNAYATLAGFARPEEYQLLGPVLAGDRLSDCSFFGYYFVRQALWELGACDWEREMSPWYHMLDLGLTTWAEDTVFWRSLCHGWSANPAIDVLTRVLGVRPVSPGFRDAIIQPALDLCTEASGAILTPNGPIRVAWDDSGLRIHIPPGVNARLQLPNEKALELTIGANLIEQEAGKLVA